MKMQAILPENHRLTLAVPFDIPAGSVEISIKPICHKKRPTENLLDFIDHLIKEPRQQKKTAIQIEQEVKWSKSWE